MSFVSSIRKIEDLKFIRPELGKEFLIELRFLSRSGELTFSSLGEVFNLIPKSKRVLNWDILMTDKSFEELQSFLKDLPWNEFSAIRVQDLGVLEWLREQSISMPIQLNLETGHHNWDSIHSHLELYPEIKRIILSQELEKVTVLEYLQKSPVEMELMVFGPTLLFYTPRPLLSAYTPKNELNIRATATSEESPHKGFPVIENRHGTFMYNTKDHSILDHVSELSLFSNFVPRIDVSWSDSFELLSLIIDYLSLPSEEGLEKIISLNPRSLHKAFFRTNKSDVLFKKLKNSHLAKIEDEIFARVLEQDKTSYTAIKLNRELKLSDLPLPITLMTTEGHKLELHIAQFTNALGHSVERLSKGDIALINPLKKASVKSVILLNHSQADQPMIESDTSSASL